jgi:hypothetical protein
MLDSPETIRYNQNPANQNQCGSVCFWAFQILPSTSKKKDSFLLFFDFLSLKTNVNGPSNSKKKNFLGKNFFYVGHLSATDGKSRIRIRIRIRVRKSVVRIHNTGLRREKTFLGYRIKETIQKIIAVE